jgi:2,5-diketo-D-gluconate reductase A
VAPQVPSVKLTGSHEIPQLGYGVFLVPPDRTVEAVSQALALGYRHIDTAEMYKNEREVGEAVRRSDIDRDEVFVTTKLSNRWQTHDDALRAFDRSLADLGFDRVDLFLVHWPLPTLRDFMDVWRALERVHGEGRATSIGVSNFQIRHLQRLLDEGGVAPAVNQIELHPYLTQEPLRSFGAAHGIVTEAWSPIARGKVLADPAVGEVADRLGRTPAQVVLRWHLQLGNVIFPKSTRPERMRENLDLFDFELSPGEMETLSSLHRDERIGPDPDTFAMVPS